MSGGGAGPGAGQRRRSGDSPGGQSEQVVHGVRVVPQAVRLLQQLEGRHAQSLGGRGFGQSAHLGRVGQVCVSGVSYLQHVQQPLPAAVLHAVLVHQDAAQVQEAGVRVHLVHAHHLQPIREQDGLEPIREQDTSRSRSESRTGASHLRDQRLQQGGGAFAHAAHGEAKAAAAALHDPVVGLMGVQGVGQNGPDLQVRQTGESHR